MLVYHQLLNNMKQTNEKISLTCAVQPNLLLITKYLQSSGKTSLNCSKYEFNRTKLSMLITSCSEVSPNL